MRLLDLYCGAGGAAMGYHRAGFDEIVGVDAVPQKRYPFEFVEADVLTLDVEFLRSFDAIHASPPCQFGTKLRHAKNAKAHVNLIPATRRLLEDAGVPWIIENVDSEAVRPHMPGFVMSCGTAFNLGVQGFELQRHRLFIASFPIQGAACRHSGGPVVGVYGSHARNRSAAHGGRTTRDEWEGGHVRACATAMGIDWMTLDEISEAIPPAYTDDLGRQMIAWLRDHPRDQEKPMAPRKSKTKPAEIGDNSANLTEQEKTQAALYGHFLRRLRAQRNVVALKKAEFDDTKKALADIFREAKNELSESRADMEDLLDKMDMTDEEFIAEQKKIHARYRLAGFPVGAQLDMFAQAPADTATELALVQASGYRAGKNGLDNTPPDTIHPALHQDWLKEWARGQADLGEETRIAMDEINRRKAEKSKGILTDGAPPDGAVTVASEGEEAEPDAPAGDEGDDQVEGDGELPVAASTEDAEWDAAAPAADEPNADEPDWAEPREEEVVG